MKGLTTALSSLSGAGVSPMEFDHTSLSQFANRLTVIKAIAVTNPKDKEARRVTLAGNIEDYESYSPAVNPGNHGIEKVAGAFDSWSAGPAKIAATAKGSITVGLKAGAIITIDDLEHLVHLIRGGAKVAIQRNLAGVSQTVVDYLHDDNPSMETTLKVAKELIENHDERQAREAYKGAGRGPTA
jgi:hypothetical protein